MFYFVSTKYGADNGTGVTINTSAGGWSVGPENAKVTLLEYGDFQCPACGAYYRIVKKMEKKFPNDLKVIFRHFPLTQHQFAEIAASAAEASGQQKKFWEMHDLLFENQDRWVKEKDPKAVFVTYAEQIGLEKEQFLKDIESSATKGKIRTDYVRGVTDNVTYTPSFYMNGKKIDNPYNEEEFTKLIDAALKNS